MSSDLVEEDDAMESVGEKCIECDVCKENLDHQTTQLPTASKHCIECQQNLCDRCSTDHRKQKLLKNHQIVDITCEVEENAAKHSQSNDEATADCSGEQTPCEDNDSANVSSGCLPTTHAQHRTNESDVMTEIKRERDRLKEYEAEMSSYVDQLLKGQEDIKTAAEKITKMILKKHSECLARLERDTKYLLEEVDSRKEEKLSETESKLQEALSYLERITDCRTNFEEIINKGSALEENDELTKSLLLHVHFQLPIPKLVNVSFHESDSWTKTDKNILGRLEGLISKTQTQPTLMSYMNFLKNVYSRTTDARNICWKLTIPNEVEMKNLYDLKLLQGVHNELELSIDDKKWEELQANHVKLANFLYAVTRPTSEASSEKLEIHLNELQRNIGKQWNTIQFHIHYKNSEKGLIPERLPNLGNTSYFNSVLQCLLQTVLLPFELTLNLYGLENVLTPKKEMFLLSKAFMELASKYNESEQRKGALETLYYTFTRATQRFSDQGQHDSHDLLIHFLEKLRVEERNACKLSSVGSDTQKMMTGVDKIFGGQFITVYTCHECAEPYAIREPFVDISIPLCTLHIYDEKKPAGSIKNPTTPSGNKNAPNSSKTVRGKLISWLNASGTPDAQSQQTPVKEVRNDAENQSNTEPSHCPSPSEDGSCDAASKTNVIKLMLETLESPESAIRNKEPNPNVSQCLKYFTRAELIKDEYMCSNCQTTESDEFKMTSATKRTLISSPPAILVLHLKRFKQTLTGFVKLDEMISYEELLDLSSFCSCSALRVDPEEDNVWYSLYAVVVHCGISLSNGHCLAYVKQRDSSAQLDDQLGEKFLQKNFGEWEKVPNDEDLAAIELRKAIKKREKAKLPQPIPGQWFYISDNFVRSCFAQEALDQNAFLLFYERIPGTGQRARAGV